MGFPLHVTNTNHGNETEGLSLVQGCHYTWLCEFNPGDTQGLVQLLPAKEQQSELQSKC